MPSAELSKLNHHTHLAQWRQLVYDCRHSGMTVRAWCVQNGVSEKTYFLPSAEGVGGNAARDSEPTAVIAASASCHHPLHRAHRFGGSGVRSSSRACAAQRHLDHGSRRRLRPGAAASGPARDQVNV